MTSPSFVAPILLLQLKKPAKSKCLVNVWWMTKAPDLYLQAFAGHFLKLALLRRVDIQKKLYIFNVYNLMGLHIYIHLWNHLHSQGNRHTALHFCHPAVTSNFTSLQQKSLIFYQIWLFSLTFQLFLGCIIIVPVPHIRHHNGFDAFFCNWLILSLVIIFSTS